MYSLKINKFIINNNNAAIFDSLFNFGHLLEDSESLRGLSFLPSREY
jgi:hypothetical protein